MADEAAAKKDRTTAKRNFTRAHRGLSDAIEEDEDVELVKEKYSLLKGKWIQVQEKYESWMKFQADYDDDEVERDETWLTDLEKKFNEVERNYIRFIKNQNKNIELLNKQAESLMLQESRLKSEKAYLLTVERSRSKRLLEENTFYGQCEYIKKVVGGTRSTVSVLSLQTLQSDAKEQFHRCKSAHGALLEVLQEEDMMAEGNWITKLQQLFLETMEESTSYIDSKLKETEKSGIKLERMKLPTFNGDIRSFPRFKADFDRYVRPKVSPESCAYILKSCLVGNALQDLVRNVDDDLTKMWKRLDDKFGQTSKLIEIILREIRVMSPIKEDDDNDLISFINKVEAGYHDLEMIKCQSEFENTTVIGLIESKLPKNTRREWAKEINKRDSDVSDENKFMKLLEFLLELRKIVEYDMSDVRSPDGEVEIKSSQHCLIHNTGSHSTENCKTYQGKTDEERMNIINKRNACWSCLQVGHRISECWIKKQCNIDSCDRNHHPSLHGAHVFGLTHHSSQQTECISSANTCLLPIMVIRASPSDKSVNVLFDGGSTISLITFSAADRLGLKKVRKIALSVVKVGGEIEIVESYEYKVGLEDSKGATVYVKAYGLPKITSKLNSVDMSRVAQLFDVAVEELHRPDEEVDLLVGFEYAAYHPRYVHNVGHLVLMENRFGKCVGGSSEHWKESTSKMIISATVNLMINKGMKEFADLEGLGIECVAPRCGSCRCGRCPLGGKEMTLKEERELKLIESGLEYRAGSWIASYPWLRDAQELPDNYQVALAILKSTERRLLKNKIHAEEYSKQINEMLQNEVARKVNKRELDAYTGPRYYVSHHEVLKCDSTTTPMRIVFNSSASYKGHILNDYWVKGPDMLNNLLGVLLRFREKRIGMICDIKRMYHSVKLAHRDQHTHRFLWRDLDLNKPPQTYVMSAVSFGDRPAGCIAMLALKKTAEMSRYCSEEAYKTIVNNTYVDDIIDCANSMPLAKELSRNIEQSLEKGGFHCKKWVYSFEGGSDIDLSIDETYKEQKVLGMRWDSMHDNFHFVVKINFSPRKRRIRTGPDLKREQIESMIPVDLTKRHVYSQVNAIFDPMGLVVPVTVKAKILIRKHFTNSEEKKDWDDPLSASEREEWVDFFMDIFELEKISFSRCIKPADAAEEDPVLVLFSDASENAYGTCAFVRWKLKNGEYRCSLLGGKSKVAPSKRVSIVRLELNAALLAKRFILFISREMRLRFTRYYLIVDSEIVLSMLQKDSYNFDTYAGVRVGEIQEGTELSNWFWIEGSTNIADWITRGKSAVDIGRDSLWQRGPDFLYCEEEEWPIKHAEKMLDIPVPLKAVVSHVQVSEIKGQEDVIDLERFSSYMRLVRCTARILRIFNKDLKPSLGNAANDPTTKELADAQMYLALRAQSTMHQEILNGKYERLSLMKGSDGEYLVGRRSERWLDFSYDKMHVMLLPYGHRFSWLYAQFIHCISHHGVATTVAKVRLRYWIVNASKMVKSIVFKCIPCRIMRKQCLDQIMSPLPIERLKPTPPFYYTSLDYFGPITIRGEVNKRSRGKCFGIIFNGMVSRPVYLDLAVDYTTNSFLSVLRRFVSIRGYPCKMYSDNGTQLVKASKELKAVLKDLDWQKISSFGLEYGLEWVFTPADAPWYNACSEALIKSTKKALQNAVGSNVLSFSELQTVCFEIANLLNERPIGRHPTSPEEGQYLCPNALLLGRATIRVPGGPFKAYTNYRQRFEFVQSIVDNYWKRMMRDYFPSLIVEAKWHVARRNIKLGDVVLIQDANAIRGAWKMAVVCKVYTDNDGHVRQCEVKYKTIVDKLTSCYTIVKRAVQRLVVVVPTDEF